MARDIPSLVSTESQKQSVEPALFVELQWASGTVRLWSGIGSKTFGGNTFTGVGTFGGVSPVSESSDGRADGVTLTLSGVPSETIAAVLTDNYQNRPGKIWLGFLDTAGAIVATDPYLLFSGKMDVATIQESGTTATISVTLENRMIILQQASGRRYTHEDQQIDYPGDLGFEYVAALGQERAVNWGQAGPSSISRSMGSSQQVY